MKKLLFAIICVALGVCYNAKAQVMSVSGDVAFYSKNMSTFTGLMFGEEPAIVSHLNACLEVKNFSMSAAYSGQNAINHVTDGDRFHMLDLSVGYKVNKEFGLCTGYELTYTDTDEGEIGHGVFAMAMYNKNKVSSNLIFFADPTFKSTYYIGSIDVRVMKNVSLYVLGGYTNTKSTPWYGLVGIKYAKGNFFTGTYLVFTKYNPGPIVSAGVTF